MKHPVLPTEYESLMGFEYLSSFTGGWYYKQAEGNNSTCLNTVHVTFFYPFKNKIALAVFYV